MKSARQNAIIELIENHSVETQDELAALLRERGHQVTQATISRDIKSLQLIKVLAPDHSYRYALPDRGNAPEMNERFIGILSEAVVSIRSAYNQIVIKTVSASADIVTEIIDRFAWAEVLGTIAGENTILMVIRSIEEVPVVIERLNTLVHIKSPERG